MPKIDTLDALEDTKNMMMIIKPLPIQMPIDIPIYIPIDIQSDIPIDIAIDINLKYKLI